MGLQQELQRLAPINNSFLQLVPCAKVNLLAGGEELRCFNETFWLGARQMYSPNRPIIPPIEQTSFPSVLPLFLH